MKVTVRGWGRDMGTTQIARHFLLTTELSESGTVRRDSDKPTLYRGGEGVTVAWYQPLKLTGNYRMEVQLSSSDLMRLFKCYFGSEIQLGLIERYGLTFSEEAAKSILKTIKLTDLTLGDLVAMNTSTLTDKPATAEALVDATKVTPFRRV